jgi:hypothetical protein
MAHYPKPTQTGSRGNHPAHRITERRRLGHNRCDRASNCATWGVDVATASVQSSNRQLQGRESESMQECTSTKHRNKKNIGMLGHARPQQAHRMHAHAPDHSAPITRLPRRLPRQERDRTHAFAHSSTQLVMHVHTDACRMVCTQLNTSVHGAPTLSLANRLGGNCEQHLLEVPG